MNDKFRPLLNQLRNNGKLYQIYNISGDLLNEFIFYLYKIAKKYQSINEYQLKQIEELKNKIKELEQKINE